MPKQQPEKPKKRAVAARKNRSLSKPKGSVFPPTPLKVTKEQRVEAQAKKQSEVIAAAAVGIRKSNRASIPSGRLLAARS